MPDHKHSDVRTTSRVAAALGGAAAAVLLAACGGSSTPQRVNPTHVEQAIARSVKAERHQAVSVTCPSGIPLRKNVNFYCVAQNATTITAFAVTETSGKGAVRYLGLQNSQVPELDTAAIETSITQSLATKRQIVAKAACPAGIPRQTGLSFVCTATAAGDKTTDFVVKQHNNAGKVTFSSR